MKIALLGDIHANLPALEAVLSHARQQAAAAIWNVGDIIGYGAYPNQVIERLREVRAISILGNYDIKVLNFPEKKSKWRKSKRSEKYLAFRWAHKQLTASNRQYLSKLPQELRLNIASRRILLTHGSPVSNVEPLTAGTPEERLEQLSRIAQADVVICGHSHQPFARQAGGVLFINTGSVGRQGDGDPRACYAILELAESCLTVQHYRVEYDTERAAAAIRLAELPEIFAQMVLLGCEFDAASADSEVDATQEL
jgi:putative phosphoesterase